MSFSLGVGTIEASHDAILIYNESGEIELVNENATDLLGWNRDEMIGSNISLVFLDEECHPKKYKNLQGIMRVKNFIKNTSSTGLSKATRSFGSRGSLTSKNKSSNASSNLILRNKLVTVNTKNKGQLSTIVNVAKSCTESIKGKIRYCAHCKLATYQSSSTIGGKLDVLDPHRPPSDILHGSRALAQKIIDSSSEALLTISNEGRILLSNNAALNLFGWNNRAEFLETKFDAILNGNTNQSQDLSWKDLKKKYYEKNEHEFLEKVRKNNGDEILVEICLSEIKDQETLESIYCAKITCISTDNEQKLDMIHSKNLTYGIIEASFDALFCINENGLIQLVNNAAVKQFGWKKDELIGRNINIIVGEEHAKNHDNYIKRYLRTGEKHVMGIKRELTARRKDGSTLTIELGLAEVHDYASDSRMFCGFVKDISRQKQDQLDLKLSHSLTASIINASFDALFTINDEGIIQMVNDAAVVQFGWNEEEFLGSNINMIVGEEHAANHGDYIRRYIETGEKRVMGKKRELMARRKDGTSFAIELGLAEVQDSSSNGRLFCGFVKDISHHKRQEIELKRVHNLTSGIIEASFDALFTIDHKGKIQMVNEAAIQQFGWSREEFLGNDISLIVGEEHMPHHGDYISRYIATGEKRVMGKKRQLIAKRKDGSTFFIELGLSEVQVNEGEDRIFCGFVKDITRQKEDELKLKRNHSLTKGIINASFDALFTIDEKGIIQDVNEAAILQFGWSRSEFLGSNISMIVGEEHARSHDHYIARYLKTGERRVMGKKRELPARRKDGSTFFIELGLTEVKTHGGSDRIFCGFVKDISRQKQDEMKLKRSHNLTKGILNASFDALFTINEKGVIQDVNEAAIKQFYWTREEFIGNNISMIVGVEHAQNHDNYIARYLKTGERRVMGKKRELNARRKDGSTLIIELGLAEVTEYNGEGRIFCGFVKDVTLQKQYEMEILKKQRLNSSIIECSFDALFTIDEKGLIQIVNEAAVNQFGWSREELIGSNISMIVGKAYAHNHDEYISRYLTTGEKRIIGKTRELMARRKDGSEFPIELGLSEAATNSNSQRVFCGFVRDITKQKHQIITSGLIEASFDAMFSTDDKGVIKMVNRAACSKFGWTKEELLGSHISIILNDGEEFKPEADDMSRTQRELEGKMKDGTIIPILLGLSEIRADDSCYYAAFVRDLTTEKRRMEIEIEKASAEALILNMLPENIATRLREDPSHIADSFECTTILFADIVGFTELSGRLSPIDLVRLLNDLFSRFDELLDIYKLNKVKTIGDCYMVTSIPTPDQNQECCIGVCHFALEMLKELKHFNNDNPKFNLQLRIGVNSGPVVAGIVGRKRFLYDLWGDAVNVASRMESTGVPGKIQVTKDVVKYTEAEFDYESRGLIQVKGKGEMETFFLKGAKTIQDGFKDKNQMASSLRERRKSDNYEFVVA